MRAPQVSQVIPWQSSWQVLGEEMRCETLWGAIPPPPPALHFSPVPSTHPYNCHTPRAIARPRPDPTDPPGPQLPEPDHGQMLMRRIPATGPLAAGRRQCFQSSWNGSSNPAGPASQCPPVSKAASGGARARVEPAGGDCHTTPLGGGAHSPGLWTASPADPRAGSPSRKWRVSQPPLPAAGRKFPQIDGPYLGIAAPCKLVELASGA